ncbi:hypothetical protein CLOM_g10080 [Closterium sp. NIES-68]|nr:hypothetical protein CLOM_g10080 [Closterium sp. NIES-68]
MSARAALWNPTVFRPEGQQDWHVVKRLFLRQCIQWDNDYKWSKHVIREMIIHHANYEIGRAEMSTAAKLLHSSGAFNANWTTACS